MKCKKCNGTGKIKHPKDPDRFFRLVDIEADKAYHVTYDMAKEKAYKKVGFDLVECPVCKGTGTVPDVDMPDYTPLDAIPRSPEDPILPGFFDDFGASGIKVIERAPGYEAVMKELEEDNGVKEEISYEEALRKAVSLKRNIDNCSEYTDAYIFGSHADDMSFGGDGPVVILKKTGRAINMVAYMDESRGAQFVQEFPVPILYID